MAAASRSKEEKILYRPGTKWVCDSCKFRFNSEQRKWCRKCARHRTGFEKTWEYKGSTRKKTQK